MLSDVWRAWGAEWAFTSVRFLPSPSWKREFHVNSLPIQWLGLFAFTTERSQVRSLALELRSYMVMDQNKQQKK